jgi:hypothetical protein
VRAVRPHVGEQREVAQPRDDLGRPRAELARDAQIDEVGVLEHRDLAYACVREPCVRERARMKRGGAQQRVERSTLTPV